MNKVFKLNEGSPIVTKDTKFDSAAQWLTLGVDFESRRIEVNMEVAEVMASITIRALLKMTEISNEPIELYLSTYGGHVSDGLAIYDAIQACPCEVRIFASGKIMSAGVIIFLASNYRVAAKNTRFMVHSLSYESSGKVKDQEIDVNEAKFVNNQLLEILAARTKKAKSYWYRKMLSHDYFFSVDEAVELGIIKKELSKKVVPDVKTKQIKVSKKTNKKVTKSNKKNNKRK